MRQKKSNELENKLQVLLNSKLLVNIEEASKLANVDSKTIRRWFNDGLEYISGDKKNEKLYIVKESLQKIAALKGHPIKIDNEKEKKAVLNNAERRLKADADAKEFDALLKEIKLLEAKNELISRDEVYKEWTGRIIELKKGLVAFANKLPPILYGLEKREMQSVILDEVYFLLKQYSREGYYCPKAKK